MADLFFYGSLRHQPLLEIVLGRSASELDVQPARLRDHAVHRVRDQPFPTIQATPEAVATGVLVRGLSDADVVRLEFYEGGFDYDLVPVSVDLMDVGAIPALVFFPAPDQWPIGELWSLQDWVSDWGDLSERAAIEVMSCFGHKTARQVAALFPGIRRRAAAHVAAGKRAGKQHPDLTRDVHVCEHMRPYTNFFAVQEMDLQVRQYDGSFGPVVNRAALIVGQAVVVLPYDPKLDAVLLVEQFRTPVYMAGDMNPWVWEPIAGFQEPGETPELAVRREAMEEAGLDLLSLHFVGGMYSSTGSSTEYLNIFIGLVDLSRGISPFGGTDEGEDLRSRIVGFDQLMQDVDGGRHRDMPLNTAALWLARHRDRRRQEG